MKYNVLIIIGIIFITYYMLFINMLLTSFNK